MGSRRIRSHSSNSNYSSDDHVADCPMKPWVEKTVRVFCYLIMGTTMAVLITIIAIGLAEG